MEFEEGGSGGSGTTRATKRTFLEAWKEFSTQQAGPNAKRVSVDVDANATDIIRVEINKVFNSYVSHTHFWRFMSVK